jgi:hypothetical protein
MDMDNRELHAVARRRVQMKRGLLIHLALYVAVNAMLFLIWNLTGRGYPWFVWPLAGWGVGVFANGLVVVMELFLPEDRAIERELRRIQH